MIRKRPWPLIILVILLASGCVRVLPGEAGFGDKIRILVLNANELQVNPGGEDIRIKREGSGRVRVNGRLRDLPLRFTASKDFVYLNGKPFRGVKIGRAHV